MNEMTKLTPKDFATDQEVRWCPGCGDYAILKAVQRTMPELGVRHENVVFVSGIGCSSRFRSEEHTSELQSLMRISYAVFCLKKQKDSNTNNEITSRYRCTYTSQLTELRKEK